MYQKPTELKHKSEIQVRSTHIFENIRRLKKEISFPASHRYKNVLPTLAEY